MWRLKENEYKSHHQWMLDDLRSSSSGLDQFSVVEELSRDATDRLEEIDHLRRPMTIFNYHGQLRLLQTFSSFSSFQRMYQDWHFCQTEEAWRISPSPPLPSPTHINEMDGVIWDCFRLSWPLISAFYIGLDLLSRRRTHIIHTYIILRFYFISDLQEKLYSKFFRDRKKQTK